MVSCCSSVFVVVCFFVLQNKLHFPRNVHYGATGQGKKSEVEMNNASGDTYEVSLRHFY